MRSISRLRDRVEELERALAVRTDELEEARRAAQEASAAKSRFLANMSHEFRTPMNAIIGFSEILQDRHSEPLSERQREHVEAILSSGRHLLELISDILDLSKIEAGRVALEPSRFLVKDLLAATSNAFAERASRRGIALEVEMAEGTPDLMEADEGRLRQVLVNLVGNAVKFTPDGGSVRLRAEAAGPMEVAFSVTDTGIGIRQEDLPRLFKEFSQIENPYTKTYEGTGLGLAMSKRIVELHGGRIWVNSAYGKGSTFAFSVPVAMAAPPAPRTE